MSAEREGLRERIEAAVFDAFEAGWFDNKGLLGAAWKEAKADLCAPILALLDSGEPERKARRCTSVSDQGLRCTLGAGHEGDHSVLRASVPEPDARYVVVTEGDHVSTNLLPYDEAVWALDQIVSRGVWGREQLRILPVGPEPRVEPE